MQRTLRLALGQFNPTVGDIAGNTARIIELIDEARASHADLVAFPELAVTGYPPEDLLFKPSFLSDSAAAVQRIAAASRGIAVIVGCPAIPANHAGDDIANAAAIINDGRVLDWYRKMYLPNYGVFDEDRYFRRGDVCPVYVINGCPVGVNISRTSGIPSALSSCSATPAPRSSSTSTPRPFHAGKARPARAHDCHPRRRQRRVRRLPQHRGRTGRAGIRRRQHRLRPGRFGHRPRAVIRGSPHRGRPGRGFRVPPAAPRSPDHARKTPKSCARLARHPSSASPITTVPARGNHVMRPCAARWTRWRKSIKPWSSEPAITCASPGSGKNAGRTVPAASTRP